MSEGGLPALVEVVKALEARVAALEVEVANLKKSDEASGWHRWRQQQGSS